MASTPSPGPSTPLRALLPGHEAGGQPGPAGLQRDAVRGGPGRQDLRQGQGRLHRGRRLRGECPAGVRGNGAHARWVDGFEKENMLDG